MTGASLLLNSYITRSKQTLADCSVNTPDTES